ncbi:MAG: hypothetical protein LBJ10_06360, partial [Clostridiales bacterium]|nr:hypothetical protein [Clostridiales bacterium]
TLGAAGDQSSRHFRAGQSFSEARRVGEAIAGEAERVLAAAHELAEPRLFAESYEFMPPVFEQPALGEAEAGAERAERALAESESEGRPYAERRSLECALFGARHRLDIAKAGPSAARIMAAALPFEIQIMGFGGCRMVFYSCEVFAEYGLRLKRESPCPLTFLSTCANGAACGYICTPESHAEGGYEAAWTSYRPETGGLMVDFTLERLKENML